MLERSRLKEQKRHAVLSDLPPWRGFARNEPILSSRARIKMKKSENILDKKVFN
jgi:hypothetical protein